jgi:predicted nucleotidyltransferase
VKLDLEPGQLLEVKRILARVVPDLSVWAFGSRVSGKAKRFSDLDLAVTTERAEAISRETLWNLRESFSDSDLPFRVDVVDLASLPPELKSAVESRHLPLQGH